MLFTADQAAARLRIPPSWLRKKAAQGEIPHTRIGRHVRFSPDDLTELIRHGSRRPSDSGKNSASHDPDGGFRSG
ncbi:helix-turn-helix domain-containing protein [Streptomyces sp. 4N509B]|uniref:helix-turn-helix domain-containing protein n=1 Tax=Streptomyces sp. 4N509B TaxID=3457413 RepID=UPI003FD5141C